MFTMSATQELEKSIQKLVLSAINDSDAWIDQFLDQQCPQKRTKPTIAESRKILENDFLKPSHEFSTEWLNKLQQYVLLLSEIKIPKENG